MKHLSFITKIDSTIKFIANLAIIVAVVLGYFEIKQNKEIEKRKIAIEAISSTKSNEFIKSFTRLKSYYLKDGLINTSVDSSIIDDINLIMGTYDNISILYKNNIADKSIIINSIKTNLLEFNKILSTIDAYPLEYKMNINYVISDLNNIKTRIMNNLKLYLVGFFFVC